MTSPRTDWTGWTRDQLDTLVAVTQAADLAAAQRDVENRRRDLGATHDTYIAAHQAWETAVKVRDELKGQTTDD